MTSVVDQYARSSPNGTATTEEITVSSNIANSNHDFNHRKIASSKATTRGLLSRFQPQTVSVSRNIEERDVSPKDAESIIQERLLMIKSIRWMSGHVPRCVMQDLTKQVMLGHEGDSTMSKMPYAKTYRAALLFIDMSGFTKLSQLLDLESLSKVRNFQLFLRTFFFHLIIKLFFISFFITII